MNYYNTEYHRRNLQVCRVIGAKASIDKALARAREVKAMPKWLLRELQMAADRLPGLSKDLADWRELAEDKPVAATFEAMEGE